jgi:hypothetical protein
MNSGEPVSGLERFAWEKAPIPALICAADGQCRDAIEAVADLLHGVHHLLHQDDVQV